MPSFIYVQNTSRPIQDPPRIHWCESFSCRLRGLMFRSHLAMNEGLLLVGERDSRLDAAIHMLFVPFDLSVIWINSSLEVVDKLIARRWRPAYVPKQAVRYILEIHPDRFGDYEIGDRIEFRNA